MESRGLLLAAILLLISLTNLLPGRLSVVMAAVVVAMALIIATIYTGYELRYEKAIALPIFALLFLFLTNAMGSQDIMKIVRSLLFGFIAIGIFGVLRTVLTPHDVGWGVGVAGAVITVLELPGSIIGTQGGAMNLPGIGYVDPIGYHIIGNANGFGILAATGLIGSFAILIGGYESRRLLVPGVCAVGVVLSGSRGAILGASAGLAAVLASRYIDPRVAGLGPLGVVVAGLCLVGIGLDVVPVGVDLSNRGAVWLASLDAIAVHPFLGWGYLDTGSVLASFAPERVAGNSPHNAFFHIGIIGGVSGVIAYVAILLRAGGRAVSQTVRSEKAPVLLALFSIILMIHFVESLTIFGVGITSLLASIIIGMTQQTN